MPGKSKSDRSPTADESQLNPLGPARRKLIRALGGAGGTILGASLVSGWRKPVVESVILPAHAQTSGCRDVGWTVSVEFPISTGNINIQLWSDTSITNSVFNGVSSASLSSSTTLNTGSAVPFGALLFWTNAAMASSGTLTMALTVTCCNNTYVTETTAAGSTGASLPAFSPPLMYPAEGECTFID